MQDTAKNEALQQARREVTEALGSEIAVDEACLVPDAWGWTARRVHKQRLKVIQGLRPALSRLIASGERVRFVTLAVRYSMLEYYFQGAFAMLNNRYALVLTDRRLILVQVHGRALRPADIKLDVPLSAIQSAKGMVLQLKLRDGSKLRLSGLARLDRKHLVEQLSVKGASGAPAADEDPRRAGEQGLRHLCPGCLEVVPGRASASSHCPNDACRIPLRSGARAAWMSALVPGAGDLYLRHFVAGAQEFLGSMFLTTVVVVQALFALYERTSESLIVAGVLFVFGIVIPRAIDYGLTLHMARKGNIALSYETAALPASMALPGGAMARPLPVFPRWVLAMFVPSGLGFVGVVGLTAPAAKASGELEQAFREAAAGHQAEARAHWQKAEAAGWVDANDRARLAIVYLTAGEAEAAYPVLDEIGDEPIDPELVEQLGMLLGEEGAP